MRQIKIDEMPAQGSFDWRRERLGKFTGSCIHQLLTSGRKKEEIFGQSALKYIRKVAAERCLNDKMVNDDELFAVFCEQTEVYNKAIAWGKEQELNARALFSKVSGYNIELPSCVDHASIANYAASPDGICFEKDCIIEIKCPNYETAFEYATRIENARTLFETEPKYYWQMQAEMDCTGASSGIFISYCPFLAKPIHYAVIDRVEDDINKLRERVKLANEFIEEYYKL